MDAPAVTTAVAPGRPLADEPAQSVHLLQIRDVAGLTGLTPRSIRYYEEMGLLRPAARSSGAYRLYDASDVERLRFIRDLRDDAGFSLAEIGRLLEDEDARIRDRARFDAAADTVEKRAILRDLVERMESQVGRLRDKAARLDAMVEAAEARRDHLRAHLAELEGGAPAHAPGESTASRGASAATGSPARKDGPATSRGRRR